MIIILDLSIFSVPLALAMESKKKNHVVNNYGVCIEQTHKYMVMRKCRFYLDLS